MYGLHLESLLNVLDALLLRDEVGRRPGPQSSVLEADDARVGHLQYTRL